YYTETGSGGHEGGLKYVFGPEAFERLAEAYMDPFTATDAQVDDYAEHFFEYNDDFEVTGHTAQGEGCSSCTGGLGTTEYATIEDSGYEPLGIAEDFNRWKTKSVATLPDGNTETIYSNAF